MRSPRPDVFLWAVFSLRAFSLSESVDRYIQFTTELIEFSLEVLRIVEKRDKVQEPKRPSIASKPKGLLD
jgi:hypothetical protein